MNVYLEPVVNALKIIPTKPIVLFTQHSVTTEYENSIKQVRPSLRAISNLLKEGIQVIITYPNNDAGGKKIIKEIELWYKKNQNWACGHTRSFS